MVLLRPSPPPVHRQLTRSDIPTGHRTSGAAFSPKGRCAAFFLDIARKSPGEGDPGACLPVTGGPQLLRHLIPSPASCHLIGRTIARVRLWLQLRRRPSLDLAAYEADLFQIETLSDIACCDQSPTAQDDHARMVSDAWRSRAMGAALDQGGRR